jgi:hypothetical protein
MPGGGWVAWLCHPRQALSSDHPAIAPIKSTRQLRTQCVLFAGSAAMTRD